MNEDLRSYIERYVSLEPQDYAVIDQYFEEKSSPKKGFLLEVGKVCTHNYFLLKGITRSYYLDANGHERIIQFGKENWWVTAMDSFINGQPSQINIQALEEVTALAISKEKLEDLYQQVPKMERLFRKVAENWLIAQQRNSHFFMKENSKERYQKLVQSIPNFVQRVPQYMIASYLDISPEYLSEIRKRP